MNTKATLSLMSATLLIAVQASAQDYTFALVDVRCDAGAISCPAGLAPGGVASQTSVRGINARGDIVGAYFDSAGKQHGFLRKDGIYSSIYVSVAGVRATIANGINPRGEIVGQYVAPINTGVPPDSPLYCPPNLPSGAAHAACSKGFYYHRDSYSTVLVPGHPAAVVQRITPDGDIYGCLHDLDTGMSMFGAAWRRSISAEGEVEITPTVSLTSGGGQLWGSMDVPMSMNNSGTPGGGEIVVGFFVDMAGQQHGYLVQNGMLYTYDPTADTNLTAIWDINSRGQFVGTHRKVGELGGRRHGFVQSADGSAPVTVEVPVTDASGTTVPAFATTVFGINPKGAIAGQYIAVAGAPARGFVAFPVSGK
jgi:hypothetical protein